MGLIVTLIIVGLILIFAEVLIIPGVGVAGILGLLSLGGSCFYAFSQMGNIVGAIVTAVNVALVVGLTVYVLRAKTWKRLSLDTNIDSKAVADDSALEIGDKGMTISRLAPMGSVRFDTELVEVKALEGFVDPEVEVEIVLMEDGKIYVKPVLALLEKVNVKGISHITGGGFYENIPRSIPNGLCAKIDKSAVKVLPIFDMIAKWGNIPERDMYNTYNMGVGMSIVVPAEEVETSLSILKDNGIDAYVIGEIIENAEEKVIL